MCAWRAKVHAKRLTAVRIERATRA